MTENILAVQMSPRPPQMRRGLSFSGMSSGIRNTLPLPLVLKQIRISRVIIAEHARDATQHIGPATPNYVHKPLAENKDQIRLMKLLPGNDGKSIHCELETFDLHRTPEYKALSYVCGEKIYQTILINGRQFLVRKNLHGFLTVFRAKPNATSTWLWVDQVCIDQSNAIERGRQVLLMAHIYTTAQETLVWLGLDRRLGLAFRAARILSRMLRAAIPWSNDEQPYIDTVEALCRSISEDERPSLHTLLRNPYWYRHWIVQELGLSKNITLFATDTETAWSDVNHVLGALRGSRSGPRNRWRHAFRLECITDMHDTDLTKWYFLMSLAKATRCDDDRDKIYGVQSLLATAARIPADYTVSPYTAFVRALCAYERAYLAEIEESPDFEGATFANGCESLAQGMKLGDGKSREALYDAIKRYFKDGVPRFAHNFPRLLDEYTSMWENDP